jgi:hypothetical protein
MTRSPKDSITANGWHEESASRFYISTDFPWFKADCELDDTSGSHRIFYNPVSCRRAVVPSHNRDVPKGTLISLLERQDWRVKS